MKQQAEAYYTTQTLTERKCKRCTHYSGGACDIVQAEPLPIKPDGSCILWQASTAQKSALGYAGGDVFIDENDELFMRKYEQVLADTGDNVKAILAGRGALRRKYQGLAVKQSQSGLVIGGWGVMFGDPVVKDTSGTYFSASDTEFLTDYYTHAPLWMEHGFNELYGLKPIGKRSKTERHAHGIWLEHTLDETHELYDKTRADIEAGKYSYSSDSLEHFVLSGLMPTDGKLSFWALAGCSLVPNPAEVGLGEVIALEA